MPLGGNSKGIRGHSLLNSHLAGQYSLDFFPLRMSLGPKLTGGSSTPHRFQPRMTMRKKPVQPSHLAVARNLAEDRVASSSSKLPLQGFLALEKTTVRLPISCCANYTPLLSVQ